MKIKHIAGVYTLLLTAAFLCVLYFFSKIQMESRDMVYYNEQQHLIETELQSGADRSMVEDMYDCSILFRTDADYKSRVNLFLQRGAILVDYEEEGIPVGKLVWEEEANRFKQAGRKMILIVSLSFSTLLAAGYLLLFVVYRRFINPFYKLQAFSAQIARGNLDFPLRVQKHNFFGAFTESFDIMREELRRARESEYRANQSKKELVAELSHDIKTPVAAIKATCEVMQAKEQNPDTLKKIGVIEGKADVIDRLIGNMFHATMEELEVLKVETAPESSLCIMEMLEELKYYGGIFIENSIPECLIQVDRLRLSQVIDNIVNNAYKYAGTQITVSFQDMQEGIRIRIRDYGQGVFEEELALLTEKYYRGSNTAGKSGTGLGLYLAKSFMEQMQGGMECYNENGFVVELFVRKSGTAMKKIVIQDR